MADIPGTALKVSRIAIRTWELRLNVFDDLLDRCRYVPEGDVPLLDG
jgi:hypothetical protein